METRETLCVLLILYLRRPARLVILVISSLQS